MDIQSIASRQSAPITSSLQSSTALQSVDNNAPLNAIDTPAVTQDLSSGGLFLQLMQVYGNEHPDEAKSFLQGVADKLHTDAQSGGSFAPRLNAWADRFQQAADTGDLASLRPSQAPQAYAPFGIGAYQQQAAQLDSTLPQELDALVNESIAPQALGSAGLQSMLPDALSGMTSATGFGAIDPASIDASIAASQQAVSDLVSLSSSALPALSSVLDGSYAQASALTASAAKTGL
jgi:hypothetical protein